MVWDQHEVKSPLWGFHARVGTAEPFRVETNVDSGGVSVTTWVKSRVMVPVCAKARHEPLKVSYRAFGA
jgi:hypothetical protein